MEWRDNLSLHQQIPLQLVIRIISHCCLIDLENVVAKDWLSLAPLPSVPRDVYL